jgi:hypothetical protein
MGELYSRSIIRLEEFNSSMRNPYLLRKGMSCPKSRAQTHAFPGSYLKNNKVLGRKVDPQDGFQDGFQNARRSSCPRSGYEVRGL